jgi:hypothetical protein
VTTVQVTALFGADDSPRVNLLAFQKNAQTHQRKKSGCEQRTNGPEVDNGINSILKFDKEPTLEDERGRCRCRCK